LLVRSGEIYSASFGPSAFMDQNQRRLSGSPGVLVDAADLPTAAAQVLKTLAD